MENTSSPSAEPLSQTGEPTRSSWYCIRTHLKHEHIASAHLRQIPGVGVFNPQLRVMRSTRQGPRWSTESLFPNYVFANFVLESGLEMISYTPAVKSVLRFGDRVPEIPDRVIEELRGSLAGLDSRMLTDAPMEAEEVEIAHGVFAGMKASVTRVLPGKQRAQILLEVMGRPVSAELSLGLVLFNRRDAAQFALTPADSTFSGRSAASSLALI
jgi:transcriptional antiterminator RfaH